MTAGQALQSNIRTKPCDPPFEPPAWMGLAQADDVTQLQFLEHAGIISSAYTDNTAEALLSRLNIDYNHPDCSL
jgi:hypothetical protein